MRIVEVVTRMAAGLAFQRVQSAQCSGPVFADERVGALLGEVVDLRVVQHSEGIFDGGIFGNGQVTGDFDSRSSWHMGEGDCQAERIRIIRKLRLDGLAIHGSHKIGAFHTLEGDGPCAAFGNGRGIAGYRSDNESGMPGRLAASSAPPRQLKVMEVAASAVSSGRA